MTLTPANVNYALIIDDQGSTVTGGFSLTRVPFVGEEVQIHDSLGNVRDCVVRRVVHIAGGGAKIWAHAWVALVLKEVLS